MLWIFTLTGRYQFENPLQRYDNFLKKANFQINRKMHYFNSLLKQNRRKPNRD